MLVEHKFREGGFQPEAENPWLEPVDMMSATPNREQIPRWDGGGLAAGVVGGDSMHLQKTSDKPPAQQSIVRTERSQG